MQDITIRHVLPILLTTSQLGSDIKGAEERDLLFARLFGVRSFVASGLIFRSSSSLQDWRVLIEETLKLGERKTWLRESAGWVVQSATRELMKLTDVEWRDEGLQAVITAVFPPSLEIASKSANQQLDWTSEKLALAVMLQEAHIVADWDSLLMPVFADSQILSSSSNIPIICRILRGLTPAVESKTASNLAGGTLGSGQLHYVWREIIDAYYPIAVDEEHAESHKKKKAKLGKATKKEKMPFVDFYAASVDGKPCRIAENSKC